VELDELHDQLSTVRDQIDAVGGISTVAAIQEALTQAENELDSILHQFQAGSANMISVRVLIKKNVVRDFLSATDYFMSALVPGIRNGYL
jgi:predicted YcjX-like family ATPase